MNASIFRAAAIVGLVLLSIAIIVPAVVLLARGNGNAPIQIISPAPTADVGLSPTGVGSAPAPQPPAEEIGVYVSGAVHQPGVYRLAPGDRLVDALEAAGGATPDADLNSVNLALRVQDEGYYFFPRAGETPPPAASAAGPPTTADAQSVPNGLINLNTASPTELATLPGIGEVRAQAIVAYRTQNGPLSSVEEVTSVTGIGEGIYQQIRDLVTVGTPP